MLGAVRGQRRGAGRRVEALRGTTQNDIVKEYLSARHLHLPARPQPRLIVDMFAYCNERAQVEPDERVLVPPAGGRARRRAGDRLLARHRHRRARRGARLGPGRPRPHRQGGRSISLLRERRHPLRRGDLQDAGLHPDVGSHHRGALRRHRPEGPPLPLRRAGQQPRPHRGAAREQRPAHRARGARRHPVETLAPGRCSCRRGTRRSACPARGTSSGRCASSRCSRSRPTCSSTATSSTARR
jgi:hypothetical protein